jgi:hypothetical protein
VPTVARGGNDAEAGSGKRVPTLSSPGATRWNGGPQLGSTEEGDASAEPLMACNGLGHKAEAVKNPTNAALRLGAA